VVLGAGGSSPLAHPSESRTDQGFYRHDPGSRTCGAPRSGANAVIQIQWKAPQAAVTVTVEWGRTLLAGPTTLHCAGAFQTTAKLDAVSDVAAMLVTADRHCHTQLGLCSAVRDEAIRLAASLRPRRSGGTGSSAG
jgi:hypothetical protein